MSIDLLYDHENLVKQTIKDDMESLLYVVLYCALHWLPHNLSKDRLSDLITAFFRAQGTVLRGPYGCKRQDHQCREPLPYKGRGVR